jgi:pyrimidine operon attenuation protein/uracil phosphoribosyltransferase
MTSAETIAKLVLTGDEIHQKIVRLAFEIYENNFEEETIYLAGIQERGYLFASQLAKQLLQISSISVELISVEVDKEAPQQSNISLTIPEEQLDNKVVILVDDVLNTGRTLAYALKPFLNSKVKKLQTAVLVDRGYPQFPVLATYVGYALATTLQELVEVKFEGDKPVAVYLR